MLLHSQCMWLRQGIGTRPRFGQSEHSILLATVIGPRMKSWPKPWSNNSIPGLVLNLRTQKFLFLAGFTKLIGYKPIAVNATLLENLTKWTNIKHMSLEMNTKWAWWQWTLNPTVPEYQFEFSVNAIKRIWTNTGFCFHYVISPWARWSLKGHNQTLCAYRATPGLGNKIVVWTYHESTTVPLKII